MTNQSQKMQQLKTRARLLMVLQQHVGRGFGLTVKDLAVELFGYPNANASQRRVRKLVEELRREGHHICADPKNGYFIAANVQELDDTCRFLYARAMTSLNQVSAMKRVSLPDIAGQLNIRLEEKAP